MAHRFVYIWFRSLKTDRFSIRNPILRQSPFVLSAPHHGRMVITASNSLAIAQGICEGMAVADARAILPALEVMDDRPGMPQTLLKGLAEWCIRYTDIVAVDGADGLILQATGCAHLWGGEESYLEDIRLRMKTIGYAVRVSIADTIGAAWAVAHYNDKNRRIEPGQQLAAILPLPPSALRLEPVVTERLHKLGMHQLQHFIHMPRAVLRRRFGKQLLLRLDQALGNEYEPIEAVQPVEPFVERLPCLEPIVTAIGIEIALQRLLDTVCMRLRSENLGIRKASFSGFRTDGLVEKIEIGTHRGSHHMPHLFKLFREKIATMEPALGIELFMIEALQTETITARQDELWKTNGGLQDTGLAELMDRLTNRFGPLPLCRFLPAEHHWPERSFRRSDSLEETPSAGWTLPRPRPLQLLSRPEPIEVTAPIPDYPPMMFRYQGKLHTIKKADGPERIESEWWLREVPHRDYYAVEDEAGNRYWLFRSGHYNADQSPTWFIHGFFA